MKTPEEMAEEWVKLEAANLDMDCDVSNGGDGKQVCLNCRHIYWGAVRGFLAGYQAAKPQWISVKERLPDIPDNSYSDRVLLFRADGFIVIARIEKCVRFVRPLQEALIVETDNGDPIEEFTHWMPLPEAPKEEK